MSRLNLGLLGSHAGNHFVQSVFNWRLGGREQGGHDRFQVRYELRRGWV